MLINPVQVDIRHLSLTVGRRRLVNDLNCRFQPGEFWCVIGPNGAGKSTLLRCLAGLHPEHASTIVINDRPLNKWPLIELAKMRSYLPQGRNDAFAYQVIETVLGARHPYHDGNYWESGSDLAIAEAALDKLDVADLANRDVRSLSGGERQRVAIAALLAQDAQLMLLDEPSNSLDLAHQLSVVQLLAQLCVQEHKTAIMVSHDINLAFGVATHALLLLQDGQWLAGPVAEIMTASNLSRCLGHPLELVNHAGQCFFYPLKK